MIAQRHPICILAVLLAGCPDAPETTPTAVVEVVDAGDPPSPDGGTVPTLASQERDAGPPPPEYENAELPEAGLIAATIEDQRKAMLRRMAAMGVADDAQLAALEELIFANKRMGQGNPAVVKHPMTRSECIERRRGVKDEKKPMCGAAFMTPLYDPAKQKESEAKQCIDRFEFPGLPCEYPMTWVTTKQAQAICKAVGKRLCDAHEWEGACAGALLPVDEEYAFGPDRGVMRNKHNNGRELIWAYGNKEDHKQCATGSHKSKSCSKGAWQCGSNTYPAGAFPTCRSKLGVYDLHGNAAEHMSLPRKPEELGRNGGFGVPEMKGSWFVFQEIDAHDDDCRWRAPAWHDNEGTNHANYHLGFRCCKDL